MKTDKTSAAPADAVVLRNIANDVCRCHDSGCGERDQCLRYLRRDTGGERTPHSPSLFPYDQPLCTPCPQRLSP